jgi:hypothetical protein
MLMPKMARLRVNSGRSASSALAVLPSAMHDLETLVNWLVHFLRPPNNEQSAVSFPHFNKGSVAGQSMPMTKLDRAALHCCALAACVAVTLLTREQDADSHGGKQQRGEDEGHASQGGSAPGGSGGSSRSQTAAQHGSPLAAPPSAPLAFAAVTMQGPQSNGSVAHARSKCS